MESGAAFFLFLGAGAVALFAFLSTAHWATTRSEERKALERFALLRKVAEQPGDSARMVLEQLREDERRRDALREVRRERTRHARLQAGVMLIVIGMSLSVMVTRIEPEPGIWTVGLIPFGIGLVIAVFALVDKLRDGLDR